MSWEDEDIRQGENVAPEAHSAAREAAIEKVGLQLRTCGLPVSMTTPAFERFMAADDQGAMDEIAILLGVCETAKEKLADVVRALQDLKRQEGQ